jgi:predicted AlkP superfamily phosphohydrolase/phosphomutase
MPVPHRRFLVIGLDGATFTLLDPLVKSGRLPFLAGLMQGGATARLTSVFPPKTIPAWYSLVTGQDPGALGIFGFTEPDGGPGKCRLIQTFRPAESVWDVLSRQGRKVGVVNFPLGAGYPVNGFIIPGMFSQTPQTYPADLAGSLDAAAGGTYLPELPPYRESDRTAWMQLAKVSVAQRARVAVAMMDKFAPEFLFVLFRETDRIEHQHWAELDGPLDRVAPDLLEFWSAVDAACREIHERFHGNGPDGVTLIVSDHGHGPARNDFFVNRWLLEQGYLKFKNGGDSLRRRVVSQILVGMDRVPGVRAVLAPVADRLTGGARRQAIAHFMTGDASFETMASKIDWNETVAYSYPVPEGIYINRYRRGLQPEEVRSVVREMRAKLEHYPEAKIEVFEPLEIYKDVNHAQAPVLLLRVNGLEAENRMDFSYPKTMLHHRPGYFYGSGIHRMDGILIAAGPAVAAKPRRADPLSLLDIAPTVLDGMELPVPAAMSGKSFFRELGLAAA